MNRVSSSRTPAAMAAALFLGASPLTSQAQDSTDTPPALPVIVVTGERDAALANRQEAGYSAKSSTVTGWREQKVVDTPFSTTTLSAEVIRDQQARSLVDLAKNDSSVTPSSDPAWYDRVNVRGFYLATDATFRDGLAINDQGSIALENKAAVEINKGLSALRYGATSPGGTLNYVVKRPTETRLQEITATGDSLGGAGLHIDLGGRYGQDAQFGYRVNLAAEEQRHHVVAFRGTKRFASGLFDWQVTPELSLELDLEHQRLTKLYMSEPNLWWWSSVDQAREAFDRLRPDSYAYQRWGKEPNEQTYVAARARYEFYPDWRLRLAYQDARLWRDQNAGGVNTVLDDSGQYEATIYYSPDQERNNKAMQAIVEGDLRLGGTRHELAIGLDHVQRDMTWGDGLYTVIGTDNLFDPGGVARPPVGREDVGPSYLTNRTRQQALAITDTVVLSAQWRVFAGLRHTQLQHFAADSNSDALSKRYDRSVVNPTMGILFKPAPTGTVYASYAEGIEQGGVVAGPIYTNDGQVLPPLESQQFELGVKWEWGADALLSAAAFRIDKGLEMDRRNGDGTLTRVQDGRQVHQGVELTAAGQVTPTLRLIAGVAYLDAKVKKTSDESLIGKRPQGVADWQANFFGDQSLEHWLAGLSVNGGVYYGGRKAVDEQNTWMADSYVRVDAGVKYAQSLAGRQELTYRLTVDNLTDRRYLANTTWGALQFGAPRTVRVSATYSF